MDSHDLGMNAGQIMDDFLLKKSKGDCDTE